MRRSVLSLLFVVGGALAATTWVDAATPAVIDEGATPQAVAVRLTLPDRALLISDSAWLGMHFYSGVDQVQGFDHLLSLASCRRRVSTSCVNYNGFVPETMFEEIDSRGDDFTTLIVATGYNDSDQRFAEDVEGIVALARSYGYRRIVWLTLRSNVTYRSPGDAGFAEVFERSNDTLRQIVEDGTYPEIVIADWATYAYDQTNWFASDGIHLRNLGGYAAGDYISRKMAFLDARPCAQPSSAGQQPFDPCPDPDEHGAVIDLESLYPVGRRDPAVKFTLLFQGSSSWPSLPWWEQD